jgi:hypothetical protein
MVWTILITIDAIQTTYAIQVLGYIETNPLGYPLGIVFVYAVLCCFYGTIQLLGRIGKGKALNDAVFFGIFLFLIVLCCGQVSAIVKNFITLSS